MGKSIILELQEDAFDNTMSITALIRKAYVIAKKLKIYEFEKWLNFELNGYTCDYEEIPNYRMVSGEIKAWNPFNGWIPVIINDNKFLALMTNRRIPDSIANLENLIRSDSQYVVIAFNNELRKLLASSTGFNSNYQLHINKATINLMIETVRNTVLDWALKLEGDGILGEDMTFSEKEKNIAQEKNYTVNHFHGVVSNSQFQQNSQHSSQTMNNGETVVDIEKLNALIKMIQENIDQVNLPPLEKREFETQLETVQAQSKSQRPNKSVILECLKSARNILEGFTGSMVASALIYHLGLFIQH